MLKVWGRANSVNVQKVLWVSDEVRVPFERIEAGGAFGVVDEPYYLVMNPNGRIPTIDDEGFILWESNVIVRYLAAKYGGDALYPKDIALRALADQWMDWEQCQVETAMTPVFWGLVRTPPEKRDAEAIERSRRESARLWEILDAHLEHRPYVAGEAFTMGDIPVGAAVHRWFSLEVERPRMPALEAWYGRLCERPGYRSHVAVPLS